MKKILKKILTRPASLSALFGYYQGISRVMKKNIGFGFRDFIFFYKNGSMTEYRYASHLLKKRVLEIFNEKGELKKKLLNSFSKDYKK